MKTVSSVAGNAWYTVFILALATFLSYVDRGVIAVVVPSLKADLHLTDLEISLLQGLSFSIFFAVAGLPMGRLADRWHRRNLIIIGIILWSGMMIFSGYAQSFGQLLVARMGVGVGEAALIPAAASIIADLFAPTSRGRPMSVIVAASSFGAAGASLLGGALLIYLAHHPTNFLPFLTQTADWRTAFVLFGLPGPVVALLLLTTSEPARVNAPTETAPSFFKFLRENRFALACAYASFALNFMVGYATALWSPTVLARVYGVSAGHAGIQFGSTLLLTNVGGGLISGFIGDSLSRRGVPGARIWMPLAAAPLVAVGGIMMLAASSATAYLVGYSIAGFGIGVLIASSYPLLFEMVPSAMRGQGTAIYMIVGNIIGMGAGPLCVAVLTQLVFRDDKMIYASVGTLTLACSILSFMLMLLLRPRYLSLRNRVAAESDGVSQA
jgi:MFS family permease